MLLLTSTCSFLIVPKVLRRHCYITFRQAVTVPMHGATATTATALDLLPNSIQVETCHRKFRVWRLVGPCAVLIRHSIRLARILRVSGWLVCYAPSSPCTFCAARNYTLERWSLSLLSEVSGAVQFVLLRALPAESAMTSGRRQKA